MTRILATVLWATQVPGGTILVITPTWTDSTWETKSIIRERDGFTTKVVSPWSSPRWNCDRQISSKLDTDVRSSSSWKYNWCQTTNAPLIWTSKIPGGTTLFCFDNIRQTNKQRRCKKHATRGTECTGTALLTAQFTLTESTSTL